MCTSRDIEENTENVSGIDIGNSSLFLGHYLQFVATYWINEKTPKKPNQPTNNNNKLKQNFSLLELQSQY